MQCAIRQIAVWGLFDLIQLVSAVPFKRFFSPLREKRLFDQVASSLYRQVLRGEPNISRWRVEDGSSNRTLVSTWAQPEVLDRACMRHPLGGLWSRMVLARQAALRLPTVTEGAFGPTLATVSIKPAGSLAVQAANRKLASGRKCCSSDAGRIGGICKSSQITE